ncbi:MAG: hypothetical protein ACE5GT_15480 [Rhodospirillales bacterium]
MKVPFYAGWALLALAFAAAAAETLPRSLPGGGGFFISAHHLWYAAWPGSLIVTQIKVETLLHPWLWDPVAVTVLKAPAWALLGVPGAFLTWFCRPHKEMSPHDREELEKQEESLFLFDRLAREAREAGYDPGEDDQRPDHAGHGLIDARGLTEPYAEDDVLRAYTDPVPGADDAPGEDDGADADAPTAEPPARS